MIENLLVVIFVTKVQSLMNKKKTLNKNICYINSLLIFIYLRLFVEDR